MREDSRMRTEIRDLIATRTGPVWGKSDVQGTFDQRKQMREQVWSSKCGLGPGVISELIHSVEALFCLDPLATPEGGPEILKEAEVRWTPEDANSQTDVLFYFSKPQQSL